MIFLILGIISITVLIICVFIYKKKLATSVSNSKNETFKNVYLKNTSDEQTKAIDELKIKISQCHKNMIISVLVCLASFALAFLFGYWGINLLIYLFVIISFGAFFVFCSFLGDRQIKVKDLAIAQTNYAEYKRILEQRADAEERYRVAAQNSHSAAHPKCPSCGSTNTKKIGNLNRTASVAMWGLASSKIGKQYQCNKCGHKW